MTKVDFLGWGCKPITKDGKVLDNPSLSQWPKLEEMIEQTENWKKENPDIVGLYIYKSYSDYKVCDYNVVEIGDKE